MDQDMKRKQAKNNDKVRNIMNLLKILKGRDYLIYFIIVRKQVIHKCDCISITFNFADSLMKSEYHLSLLHSVYR